PAGPFLANGGIRPGSLSGGGNLTQKEARLATSSYIPNQIPPTSVQWNVGIQHVYHSDYTIEARYLGSKGYHLLTQNRLNIQNKTDIASGFYLPTYTTAPSQGQLDALKVTLAQIQAKSRYVPAYSAAGFGDADPANPAAAIVGFMPWGSSFYNGLALQLPAASRTASRRRVRIPGATI